MKAILLLFCSFSTVAVWGQFEPSAGVDGSTAIDGGSTLFKGWATSCVLERGYQTISDTSLGLTTIGNEQSALGAANQNGVVSLGDGGRAILGFDPPIADGTGFDFAVFENGFHVQSSGLDFLEYAFVEVSSDGEHFYRFPSHYQGDTTAQVNNNGTDTRLYHNLAGKYVAPFGVPFDLQELSGIEGLDIHHVTYVRIEDVVGDIDPKYARRDSQGRKINDPWPTPFSSSGFDLDAVGVLNASTLSGLSEDRLPFGTRIFPIPAKQNVTISTQEAEVEADIQDLSGKHYLQRTFAFETHWDLSSLCPGVYLVTLKAQGTAFTQKIVIQ